MLEMGSSLMLTIEIHSSANVKWRSTCGTLAEAVSAIQSKVDEDKDRKEDTAFARIQAFAKWLE
jgi:hypothetical protein